VKDELIGRLGEMTGEELPGTPLEAFFFQIVTLIGSYTTRRHSV